MTENMVFALIPITAIALGLCTGMLKIGLDYRKKREFFQLHHAERMAAIDRGIELPPLSPEFFADYQHWRPTSVEGLRRGLVWLLAGSAITLALFVTYREQWVWGLVPTAIGAANLLFYRIAPPGKS